jgi:hypothetical protein
VDSEVISYFREYRFRAKFGGSHDDFLTQPREVTDWLMAIDGIVNGE